MDHSVLLNEKGAASYLSVDFRTLQAWRMRGTGPTFHKIGRCVRYRESDLEAYLEEAKRKPTSANDL